MIYRFRVKSKEFLDGNGDLVNFFSTTYTNNGTEETATTNFNQNEFTKNLVLPLYLDFKPMDNSDLIDDWVEEQKIKSINKISDLEKIKYRPNNRKGYYDLNFRFKNISSDTYNTENEFVGFDLDKDSSKNIFKKSYFRLYFYDDSDTEKSNLLFVEDLDVSGKLNTLFRIDELYWDKEIPVLDNISDRVIYMDAKFFNAKTGKVHGFYNTSSQSIVDVVTYSNNTNRMIPIKILNPNKPGVDGDRRFQLQQGDKITLSEFIIK